MKHNRTFRITLDEQQYQDVIFALEIVHRVSCGQVEELRQIGNPFRNLSDQTLMQFKVEVFPELQLNQSYGWDGGHADKYLDRLQASTYQIYREMLHVRTVDDADKEWSAYKRETLTSDKAKLPKIEIIKNKQA